MNRSQMYRITAILLFVAACRSEISSGGDTGKVAADKARLIAEQRLASTEFAGAVATFVGFYDSVENPCLTFDSPDPVYRNIVANTKRKLENRRYYLVMYEPPSDTIFGSTICVFVDESGDVVEAGMF